MSNENLFNHCHGKKTFPSPQSVRQERQDEKRTMPLAHIPTIKKRRGPNKNTRTRERKGIFPHLYLQNAQ